MSVIATRRLHFDAGHRVMEHESKCKYLHGHRYVVDVSFRATNLDALGRVIDFGVIKDILGKWIDDNWDHNVILYIEDKKLGASISKTTNQKIFYLPSNPTAENIASYLKNEICPKLFKEYQAECFRVCVYETPNCYAEI